MPNRNAQEEYPTWVGFVFIFNLIVGTGALTLPSAFSHAGWVLGSGLIVVLAFVSYMTVTFVIETMSCANAIQNWKRLQYLKRDRVVEQDEDSNVETMEGEPLLAQTSGSTEEPLTDGSIEQTPLNIMYCRNQYYSLSTKVELAEMANLFFGRVGRFLFYFCLAVYLYGDLSIYSAAVAKSLRDVICAHNHSASAMDSDDWSLRCWEESSLSRFDIYRICLVVFIGILGPFTFFNVQKTKYLQLITVLFRWLAFSVMISIAIHRLFSRSNSDDPPIVPKRVDINGIPYLIGTCIYSFMCHHSLPSLLTPISNKRRLKMLLSADYALICAFYLSLALTGIFAFAEIKDLYTLNFVPSSDQDSIFLKTIEYFLALFPVFTLSASFPIIAITLRSNLQTLFLDTTQIESYNFFLRKLFFPLLAIVPPICICFFTESVVSLVGFTGCYAGTGIQYLIPIGLVFAARRTCESMIGRGILNDFRSPFKGTIWLVLVLCWTIACLVLVTIDLIK
ncbi:transmembrane protein 104 homolog [Uranotaenia lowii]|uniref:transmembrane protein 104 homolog n=1 Tax=Uranotaenia lowii TaxID=190385 RepID=UPI00247AB367|nr:transmembrane protein 104 homolog [Uranotaenia lowii]XP_055608865.1 transmembrane protein 104 homolog [Uranotaenia lowii]